MYDQAAIENACIAQKDALFDDLRDGRLDHLMTVLTANRELWKALRYSYKGQELCKLAAAHCNDVLAELKPQATRQRKDWDKRRTDFWALEEDFRTDQQANMQAA